MLVIYPMESSSMKGIHTSGRRFLLCAMRGKFYFEELLKHQNKTFKWCLTASLIYRYTLKGLNYMICKRSGWAGEFPSCEGTVMWYIEVLELACKWKPNSCETVRGDFKW